MTLAQPSPLNHYDTCASGSSDPPFEPTDEELREQITNLLKDAQISLASIDKLVLSKGDRFLRRQRSRREYAQKIIDAIHEAGYRKIEGEPPILSEDDVMIESSSGSKFASDGY